MKSLHWSRFNRGPFTPLALLLAFSVASARPAAEIEFPQFETVAAREYLQAVARGVQGADNSDAELRFVQARLHSQLGQHDQAERLAKESLALGPRRAEVLSFLGDLFIRQDRLDDALTSLKEAVNLNPNLEGGYRRLGMIYDRLGNPRAAGEAFTNATRAFPTDTSAWLLLGRYLLDQGQTGEAEVHLQRACSLDPTSANNFYALWRTQSKLGKDAAAQASFETFQALKRKEKLRLDAKNAERDNDREIRSIAAAFHSELARLLLSRERGDLAVQHLRQAIRIAPGEPSNRETLAAIYLQMDKLAEARPILQELVQLRPENATYRVNLGTLLLQLKEYPAAMQQLNRTLELDPQQVQALNNLTRFYLGTRQNLPEALELCRRLVDIQPTAANCDLLAWACYANGQLEQARAASARSIELDPDNLTFRERYRRLMQLP